MLQNFVALSINNNFIDYFLQNSSDNQVFIPVYSEHLQISQVDNACTLEQFCQSKNIPYKKCNVFPELGALKDTIAWKNVRDIILLDKVIIFVLYNIPSISLPYTSEYWSILLGSDSS